MTGDQQPGTTMSPSHVQTSPRRTIEAAFTTALCTAISIAFLRPVMGVVDLRLPLPVVVIGAAIAAANGAIMGSHGGYRWSRPSGWVSSVLDSTWGLPNTGAGVIFHLLSRRGARLRNDLSRRKNRLVYEGSGGPAVSLGTCVMVMTGVEEPLFTQLLAHETLHTWQGRLAGPIISVTYPAWVILSIVVGLAVSPAIKQPRMKTVLDLAVMDNPWELMAYWWKGPYPGHRMGGLLSLV